LNKITLGNYNIFAFESLHDINEQSLDYSYTYFSDDDFEIKPGKTISKELTCYENYDSFIFCLTGRR